MTLSLKTQPKTKSKLRNPVLQQLYVQNELSCAELSERLNKSMPSVAKALDELIEEGYIVNSGYAASSGGRRPLTYSLKANKMYILAVAMDQLFTRIAIVDLKNNYVSPVETLDLELLNNDKALPYLIKTINNYITKSGIKKNKIIGAGFGMPGFVNADGGINHSYMQNGCGTLQQHLQQHLGLPVYIDNDSSLTALAELKFGLARGKQNVMVVNIGWGIGLGMIINGTLFRGHKGYAGELSHIPISDSNTLCNCGKRGCLEIEASLLVIARSAKEKIKQGKLTSVHTLLKDMPLKYMGEAILDAANKGDQFAIELLSGIGYKIGKGVAILIHINNPELIVLSGRGAKVGKIIMPPIQNGMNQYAIPRLAEYTEVKVSDLGYDAELIGAAALVMEKFGIIKN